MTNKWSNKDNFSFYERITVDKMEGFIMQAGLANGEELACIYSLLSKARSIFEVGGGTGRVLRLLREKFNYLGDITVLEKSNDFCRFLTKQFGSNENIHILQGELLSSQLTKTFDIACWLWSGISDFNVEEQRAACVKLRRQLNKGGALVVDTLMRGYALENESENANGSYTLEVSPTVKVHGYMPSETEMRQLLLEVGFLSVSHLVYFTGTGDPRNLFVAFC